MQEKSKEINLRRYWPFWGLHFGIHIIIGLAASAAGLVVIFSQREVLNGFALVLAGSFAIINGWQGCRELSRDTVAEMYINVKESDQ